MKHPKMWTCVNKNSTTDLQQSFTTLALSSLEAELFLDLNIIVKGTEAEFKEFEPRLKFKPRLKYGWFYLKCIQFFKI